MNICPITYLEIPDNVRYSTKGLHLLSNHIDHLNDLPWSAEEQREQALIYADKLSIQGVQPKLSARLNTQKSYFDIVTLHGRYILKPPHQIYPQTAENEDLSMRIAATVGIEVPLHGLIYARDNSLTYFIKRFDRAAYNKKLHVEDFAQLSHHHRDTKYQSSMEKLITVLDQYCTFPQIEKSKLFLRTLVSFLIGNEDMHLKNFSLIERKNKIELSPAYDYINSTIILKNTKKELALPLNGKKKNLTKKDFLDYFAKDRLKLSNQVINKLLNTVRTNFPEWERLISISFLNEEYKKNFLHIVQTRAKHLIF